MTLLLVEDFASFARLVMECFAEENWTLIAERESAIEAIEAGEHDGLVVDLWLRRRVEGWAIVELARRRAPQMPLLLLGDEPTLQARVGTVELADRLSWRPAIARLRERVAASTAYRTRRFAATHDLTRRETEVLQHYVKKRPAREIADTLGIAVPTVRFHLNQIRLRSGFERLAEIRDRLAG